MKNKLELAFVLAIKNVKIRYKNSLLGYFWSLLTPLIYLGIFVTIFKSRFPEIENYPLYALTGLIFWNFFNTTSNQILTSIISSAGVLKSINVPTLIFPISALVSSVINLALSLIPFFVLMLFFGFRPSLESIQIIYILVMFCMFTLGFGLILSALNVYFRDVGLLWTTIIPALFYFTPIVYMIELLPERMQLVMQFNPIHQFLSAFRMALYTPDMAWMSLGSYGTITALGFGFLYIGYSVFHKLEKGFYSHY
ncbi:ABC transporter permease [Cytophagaceae bacterium ABcell3]|nr:ABC transporter permease [Cytophagaceae bacterium ABcell3]